MALAGLGAALIVVAGFAYVLTQRPAGKAADRAVTSAASATFVGSEGCAECHAPEMHAWRGSQHQLVMQAPDEKSVLGDFNDASFTCAGVTSSFLRRDGRYVVRTDGPDGNAVALHSTGRPAEAIEVLQQALRQWPRERDLLFALASFQRDSGAIAAARRTVRTLLEAYPGDTGAQVLDVELRQ